MSHQKKKNLIGKNIVSLRTTHQMSRRDLMIQMQLFGIDISYASLAELERQNRSANDKEIYAFVKIFHTTFEFLTQNCDAKERKSTAHRSHVSKKEGIL